MTMISKLLLSVGLVTTMGFLSVFFPDQSDAANSKAAAQAEVYKVDLSGNTLVFQLPDSYSREMLTDPVKASADLFDAPPEETSQIIAQRWWDFDKKSFFGSDNLGHVVMTVRVVTQGKDANADFFLRNQLITYIHQDLIAKHREEAERQWNHGDSSKVITIPALAEQYRTLTINGHNWLQYYITDSAINSYYVLPLTRGAYLEVSYSRFISAKLAVKDRYDFYTPVDQFEESVISKFELQYAQGVSVSLLQSDSDVSSQEPLVIEHLIRPVKADAKELSHSK